MKKRTFILVSVPNDFVDKMAGFINNINMLNNDSSEIPIKVENVYFKKKQDFAAIPKERKV